MGIGRMPEMALCTFTPPNVVEKANLGSLLRILNFFYKNIVAVGVLAWFQIYDGWSAN
jgi:hypothetical protein